MEQIYKKKIDKTQKKIDKMHNLYFSFKIILHYFTCK